MPPLRSLLALLWAASFCSALGEPCKVSNNRLDPNTHKFQSDCGPTEYCAPLRTNSSALPATANATTAGEKPEVRKRIRRDKLELGSILPVELPDVSISPLPLGLLHGHRGSAKHHRAGNGHESTIRKRAGPQNIFLADGGTASEGNSTGTAASNSSTISAGSAAVVGSVIAVCQPKGCRRDEFPFGYGQNDILPPRCALDQFCPDEEDECKPLIPLGGACQLNRDDECEPPSSAAVLTNDGNFNGSMCLSYTCIYADVELGDACKIDNTVYSGYLPDGSQFTDIVSRDNCVTGLYCSNDSLRCEPRLGVGRPCTSDSQCLSGNCDISDVCVAPPETPASLPRYVYVLVPLGILASMAGLVFGLWRCHQGARARRARVMQEYWSEQMSYRRSILSMHLAAEKDRKEEERRANRASRHAADSASQYSGTTYSSADTASSEASSEDYDQQRRRARREERERFKALNVGELRYAR